MKALITASGQFGPFSSIETMTDRYRCDGVDYQFSVIGDATIGEYVAPPPVVDLATLQAAIVAATQARLDDFAKTRNYDGILSACTYSTSSVPKFLAEGQVAVSARDTTWAKLYETLADVEAGIRPAPSGFADIESELPVLEWPA